MPANVSGNTCQDTHKQEKTRNLIIALTVASLVLVFVAVATLSLLLWLRKRRNGEESKLDKNVAYSAHDSEGEMESNPVYAEVTSSNLAPAQATAGVPVFPNTAYGADVVTNEMVISRNEAYEEMVTREADAGAYAVRDLVVDVDYEPVETTGDSLQYNRQHVSPLIIPASRDPGGQTS